MDLTLEDDFLPMMPGVLFDSHFIERGRFGRLLGFMARWQHERGSSLLGVGVDDMTALAIDSTLHSTVYGTGAVSFYRLREDQSFAPAGQALGVEKLEVFQLLHLCQYDFVSGDYEGLKEPMLPSGDGESGSFRLLVSGGNDPEDNLDMCQALVHECGEVSDSILLFAGSLSQVAGDFAGVLLEEGAAGVEQASPSLANASNPELEARIRQAKKFLFVDLNLAQLKAFMESGPAGAALDSRIRQAGIASAFVGKTGMLAGRIMVENYEEEGASYAGELGLSPGLGLLSESVIQPDTYVDPGLYENTASGVPFALVQHQLRFGIWLSPGNFMLYAPGGAGGELSGYGDPPVMILDSREGKSGMSTQTSYGDGKDLPRNVAGFTSMALTVLEPGQAYSLGKMATGSAPGKPERALVRVYPNPSNGMLFLESRTPVRLRLLDMGGRTRWESREGAGVQLLQLGQLESGSYLLEVHHPGGRTTEIHHIQLLNAEP
jgi:hypothetical protein